MALFGKSFEEKVYEAMDKLRPKYAGMKLTVDINDKVVTLKGEAPDLATKAKIMTEFNGLVETENTINQISIKVATPAAAPPEAELIGPPAPDPGAAPSAATRVHEVIKGDTLGAIAKKYYGNAGKYMKIFEANRDILDNPDLIKVGQKLKIPE